MTNAAKAAPMDTMQYKSECFQAGPLGYGKCGNDCDTFCSIVTGACPTAYKSMQDCEDTCGQFSRQVEFGMRARDEVAIAARLELAHERRADHPAMPCNEDACVLVHGVTRDVPVP